MEQTNEVSEARFRAMGSDIHLIVVAPAARARGLITDAEERIAQLEQRWSRFRPDSEISLLNRHAGESIAVSADTRLLLERSVEAWRITGGGFDPTLLDALIAAGYDRSFEQLAAAADPRVAMPASPVVVPRLGVTRPGCTEIVFADDSVTLPAGMGFDPGGIGKGLAADIVAGEVMDAGADGVCINMGGDVKVLGDSPTGPGWTLAIEHPWRTRPISLVGLGQGAVATSSVLRKAWTVGGDRRHHLIDQTTEQPSTSDVALAAVVAGDAWLAEVLAKAVLLRGSARAFDLIGDGTAAVIVDHDGVVTASAGFTTFTGGRQPQLAGAPA